MPPPGPSKIIAVHLNYGSRAAQRGRVPAAPSYFLKPPSSLAGDGDPIVRPQGTELLTFEGEVALVIARAARGVAPEDALAHVGWYAPANDVGVHDMRWNDRGSNVLSKGHDGFTPLGPPVAGRRRRPRGHRPAHARQRRGRAGRFDGEPALPVRAARRRPLALHDARAGRHHSHRHAGRHRGPSSPGDVVEVELSRPLVGAQPDRRGRCPDSRLRRAAARLAGDARCSRSASTRRGP